MYCVVLQRNDKMIDRQIFESAVDALNNMLIMIAAAALSCDDIPNISAELFECEKNEKTLAQEIREKNEKTLAQEIREKNEKTLAQEIRENCVMTNIIVTGNEKPYYLIEYYDKRDNQVYHGFGSKKFETVKTYQKEYFENCKDDN